MNTNEWQTIHWYQSCLESAKRNGFEINQCENGEVQIIAKKEPYVNGVCVKRLLGFYAALCWFDGYEQQQFETKNTK